MWITTTILTILASAFLLVTFSKGKLNEKVIVKKDDHLGINEYQLYAAVPEVLSSFSSNVYTADARAEILKKFLAKHKSVLEPYSQFLVEIADIYNLDFRLLPAIAMQESNLCKKIPKDSYNCWGYGIYGDKVTRFSSYEEAIETVAKSLRNQYIDKGLISPEEIMQKYTPQSQGSWARAVLHFIEEMR